MEAVPVAASPVFAHPLVHELYRHGCAIDPEVLAGLRALGGAVVPDLEAVLEDARLHRRAYEARPGRETCFPVHALFLLAELGARRSFPRILQFLRQDGETLAFWLGDLLTEELWEVVVKCGEDHLPAIREFLLDPAVYALARVAVASGLAQLALRRPGLRAEAVAIFRKVLGACTERGEPEAGAVTCLVDDLLDLGATELEGEIRAALAGGWVDDAVATPEEGFLDEPHLRDLAPIEERYRQFQLIYCDPGGDGGSGDDGSPAPRAAASSASSHRWSPPLVATTSSP